MRPGVVERLGVTEVAGVMSASGSRDEVTETSPSSPGVCRPSSRDDTRELSEL